MQQSHPHPQPHTDPVDLQIVGGGLAGLVAANRAADAGLTVRLIERHPGPGGRAASTDHHGYTLNLGPHALYLQGELRRFLVDLDLDPPGAAPELAGATGSIGQRAGLLPLGAGSAIRTHLLPVAAKRHLPTLLARLTSREPAEVAHLTVDRWLDGLFDRPDVRALAWGLVNLATYNAASDLASADAAVSQLRLTDGVRYVAGGWQTIVDALSDRADRLGVERVTATVTAVTPAGGLGEPTTVSTDGGSTLAAGRALVAAGGPAVADRLLGLDGRLVAQAGPAVEASVLDLGLRRRPKAGAHLGLDAALYATVHSVTPGLAPEGRHLVMLARYRRPGDDVGPDETRALLDAHGRAMDIDPADIEMARYLHRLMVTGGMPLAERGGLAGRPTVTVEDRPGVLLAGDWVGPRGLLADASAASAIDAVEAVTAGLTHAPAGTGRPDRSATLEPR